MQRVLQTGDVAFDLEVKADDGVAGAVKDEEVRLSDGNSGQIDAPRGAHHDVGNVRIGHQHVMRVGGQIENKRFVERQDAEAMTIVANRIAARHAGIVAWIGKSGISGRGGGGRHQRQAKSNHYRHAQEVSRHVTAALP